MSIMSYGLTTHDAELRLENVSEGASEGLEFLHVRGDTTQKLSIGHNANCRTL